MKTNKILSLAFVLFFVFQGEGFCKVEIQELQIKIPMFDQLDPDLYRGGQPDEEGFKLLKKFGIKTVINFRAEKDLHEEEKALVESLGMQYIHLPWTIYGRYRPEIYPKFKEAIGEKKNLPVFFHCRRGSERTGVVSAVYRMDVQGLDFDPVMEYAEAFNLKMLWKGFVKDKIKKYAKDNIQ